MNGKLRQDYIKCTLIQRMPCALGFTSRTPYLQLHQLRDYCSRRYRLYMILFGMVYILPIPCADSQLSSAYINHIILRLVRDFETWILKHVAVLLFFVFLQPFKYQFVCILRMQNKDPIHPQTRLNPQLGTAQCAHLHIHCIFITTDEHFLGLSIDLSCIMYVQAMVVAACLGITCLLVNLMQPQLSTLPLSNLVQHSVSNNTPYSVCAGQLVSGGVASRVACAHYRFVEYSVSPRMSQLL